jgi:hypothetical protein
MNCNCDAPNPTGGSCGWVDSESMVLPLLPPSVRGLLFRGVPIVWMRFTAGDKGIGMRIVLHGDKRYVYCLLGWVGGMHPIAFRRRRNRGLLPGRPASVRSDMGP